MSTTAELSDKPVRHDNEHDYGSGSLLAALYGQGGQSVNSFGQNPVTALTAAEKDQTQDIKMTAAQPAVKRAMDAFTAGVEQREDSEAAAGESGGHEGAADCERAR